MLKMQSVTAQAAQSSLEWIAQRMPHRSLKMRAYTSPYIGPGRPGSPPPARRSYSSIEESVARENALEGEVSFGEGQQAAATKIYSLCSGGTPKSPPELMVGALGLAATAPPPFGSSVVRCTFLPCFDTEPGVDAEAIASQVAQHLRLRGGLFLTGGAYHFIADRPIVATKDRLVSYLSALKGMSCVDQKWVDFCVARGNMFLRVTRGFDNDRPEPRLVALITE